MTRKTSMFTALDELSRVLDPIRAQAVIDHRAAKRAKLTPYAAGARARGNREWWQTHRPTEHKRTPRQKRIILEIAGGVLPTISSGFDRAAFSSLVRHGLVTAGGALTDSGRAYVWKRSSPEIALQLNVMPEPNTGCWLWYEGSSAPYGYGILPNGAGLAHRKAWEIANGRPVPEGMKVCHKCDQPACVNAEHLFLGTQSDNMADMKKKGRASSGAIHSAVISAGRAGL